MSTKTIGRHKYKYLKSLSNPTNEELQQIKVYEDIMGITKQQEFKKAYARKITSSDSKTVFNPTARQVYDVFLKNFFKLKGVEFIQNETTLNNLKPLIYYFSKDERFYSCPNISSKVNFGNIEKETLPSFKKGLLIIGGYGNGKTSCMETFYNIFRNTPYIFKTYTANQVIEEYEYASSPNDKKWFWDRMNALNIHFDDIKTERLAYGKTNLFKDIFEKRYANQRITHLTANYHHEYPGNINQAIEEFGERYGGRVFDRIFEMFNIIEFKGKSFRR